MPSMGYFSWINNESRAADENWTGWCQKMSLPRLPIKRPSCDDVSGQCDPIHEPVGAHTLIHWVDSRGLVEVHGEGPDPVRDHSPDPEETRAIGGTGTDLSPPCNHAPSCL